MTKKLLLADDSITIQKVIGIIFATEDYELLVSDDGNEAFDKALAEYPDLVIADIVMPGRDGFELCQAIKSEPRLEHTSVLLLPGTFESFDENRAEAVGADGWLSKPFESQALLDKVAQLLEAEPVRLSAVEETAATDDVDFAVEEVVDDVAETVVEENVASEDAAVDDVILGLDEVDELGSATDEVLTPATDDESADDIWDAVSFEEEDLRQAEDLSPAVETDLTEEFALAGETPVELVAEDTESDFVLEDAEEPLELTDEVVEEVSLGEPLGFDDSDETPMELEEEAIIDEVEESPVTDFSSEEAEELPVVEAFNAESAQEDEEVLDLGEEDILAEELLEEVAEEDLTEQPFVLDDEVATVDEPAVEEPEATEETGFYYDASGPEEQESASVASVTEFAAEPVGVAAATESSSVERVEQQLRGLSEDELKEVVAKVAGPTIEKLANEMLEQIVWEVVPDLAESMIREEIRKIRQGAE